ncbi:MAG: IclR family transcriptional regulator [Nocardioidaceae bacterium]
MADRQGVERMTHLVQSVSRALTLLEAVSEAPSPGATIAELAGTCELNKATVWRLLATLEAHYLVHPDPVTHRYSLGLGVPKLAVAAHSVGLTWQDRAVLDKLSRASGETADLAVVRGLALTYVAEVSPPTVLRANWLGRTVPLHATSTGKTLLAWLSEDERDALLTEPLPRFTPATVTDPQELREELIETRRRGYGVCAGELEDTLYGVSAPVLDRRERPFAVVSAWGPSNRVPASRFDELGELARTAAGELRTVWVHPGRQE